MINYYNVLGLDNFSEQSQIKAAYRQLCLQLHPDRQSAGCGEAALRTAADSFQHVAAAYAVLRDEDHRSKYDRRLKRALAPAPAQKYGTCSWCGSNCTIKYTSNDCMHLICGICNAGGDWWFQRYNRATFVRNRSSSSSSASQQTSDSKQQRRSKRAAAGTKELQDASDNATAVEHARDTKHATGGVRSITCPSCDAQVILLTVCPLWELALQLELNLRLSFSLLTTCAGTRGDSEVRSECISEVY
jgi:DnaJ-class molecular chaperone